MCIAKWQISTVDMNIQTIELQVAKTSQELKLTCQNLNLFTVPHSKVIEKNSFK